MGTPSSQSPTEAQPLLLTIRGTLPHALPEDVSSTYKLTAAGCRAERVRDKRGGAAPMGSIGRALEVQQRDTQGKLFRRKQATGRLISKGKNPDTQNVR